MERKLRQKGEDGLLYLKFIAVANILIVKVGFQNVDFYKRKVLKRLSDDWSIIRNAIVV